MFVYSDNYVCHFQASGRDKVFPTWRQAMTFASHFVGNSASTKIFDGDDSCWLFGPGDGDTSMTVRREVVALAHNPDRRPA